MRYHAASPWRSAWQRSLVFKGPTETMRQSRASSGKGKLIVEWYHGSTGHIDRIARIASTTPLEEPFPRSLCLASPVDQGWTPNVTSRKEPLMTYPDRVEAFPAACTAASSGCCEADDTPVAAEQTKKQEEGQVTIDEDGFKFPSKKLTVKQSLNPVHQSIEKMMPYRCLEVEHRLPEKNSSPYRRRQSKSSASATTTQVEVRCRNKPPKPQEHHYAENMTIEEIDEEIKKSGIPIKPAILHPSKVVCPPKRRRRDVPVGSRRLTAAPRPVADRNSFCKASPADDKKARTVEALSKLTIPMYDKSHLACSRSTSDCSCFS